MIKITKLLVFTIPILISIWTIIPLLNSGFFDFHDNTAVARVFEMGKSLQAGMFPVRWVEDLGYGYGYPIFNFYAPFPYYIGGIFYLLGFNALLSTKLMITIGMVLPSCVIFFLARKHFGLFGAALSASVYSFFPYHAVNLYVRGAMGELFAYSFLPLFFLGLFKLWESKKVNYKKMGMEILAPAGGIFLISISHNLTALMTALISVPFVILSTIFSKNKKNFLILAIISVFAGVALSSFYIIPSFLEMKFTNVASQIGGGADFRDHFVCLEQFWDSQWGFGGSVSGCTDGLSFKLGKINIALLIMGILLMIYRLYKKKFDVQEKIVICAGSLVLVSAFLTTEYSKVIWENIPYIEFIQYPWRFMNFIALGISIIAGYVVFAIGAQFRKNISVLVALIGFGIVFLTNQKNFYPQYFTHFNSEAYTNISDINFRVSKISDEYMPKGFLKPKDVSDLPLSGAQITSGIGNVGFVSNSPTKKSIFFNLQTDGFVHVNTAYFPAWKAYIENREVPLKESPKGMDLEIKKGHGTINLIFKQTPIEKLANALSVLAFLTMLIGIMLGKSYGQKTS